MAIAKRAAPVATGGLVFWAIAIALALSLGAVGGADAQVITELRLPRVLLASAVGIGLSVAGATLQALFSNPLCEPFTLGISSGAALGAALGATLGLELNVAGLAGSAFLGAILFALLLHLLSLRKGSTALTLLSGVMLQFLGSSLVAVWMALADPRGIQSAIFWLMGDLSRATLPGSALALVMSVVLSAAVLMKSRSMDALLMGEDDAASLGVDVRSTRRTLVVLSALLVGLCVSSAGMIGFIGLVVPHFVRARAGALHRTLIPVAAIWGAATLTFSDMLARVVARPYELPVGVVTALVGAPLFIAILFRRRRGGQV